MPCGEGVYFPLATVLIICSTVGEVISQPRTALYSNISLRPPRFITYFYQPEIVISLIATVARTVLINNGHKPRTSWSAALPRLRIFIVLLPDSLNFFKELVLHEDFRVSTAAMTLFGAELLLLKPLIVKYLGHQAATGAASALVHMPAHAVAISAHTVASNILLSAASAGTALGAVKVLFAGGKAAKKILARARKIQSKADLERAIKSSNSGLDGAEKQQLLITLVTLAIVEAHYASLGRPTHCSSSAGGGWLVPDGSTRPKTRLEDMEPCGSSGCDCGDYIYGKPSGRDTDRYVTGGYRQAFCKCNHRYSEHNRITETELDDPECFRWLMWLIAEDVYPSLEHRNEQGLYKTKLGDIKRCGRCACPDFDWDPGAGFISQYCVCEHRDSAHTFFISCSWVVGRMVAHILELMNKTMEKRKEKAKKTSQKKPKNSAKSKGDSSEDDSDVDDSDVDDSDVDDSDVDDSDVDDSDVDDSDDDNDDLLDLFDDFSDVSSHGNFVVEDF